MSRFKEYDNRNSNYLLSTSRPDNRSLIIEIMVLFYL